MFDTKKEKPAYSTLQNTAYVIKNAWQRDKIVLWVILVQIFLTVALSTVGIFLPAAVVERITSGASVESLIITILAFTAVLAYLRAANNYFETKAQVRRIGLRGKIGLDIMMKVIGTDYANLEDKKFTDAKQKAQDQTSNNNTSTEQIYFNFTRLGTNILGFVVYIILLAAISPFVLLITAATTVFGAAVRHWANKWRFRHDNEQATFSKRLWFINSLGANFNYAKDIRLFNMVPWLRSTFAKYVNNGFNYNRMAESRQWLADATSFLGGFVRDGVAYAYLIWQVLEGNITVDIFVLLFAAVGGFSGWISGILEEIATLNHHSLNYCRIREFLEFPNKFTREGGDIPPKAAQYKLELKNITFRYSGSDVNVLENVSLSISPGEKLAIVGLNGAGKTTLVKLLCGLYDPTEGEVLLNGTDIRTFNRDEYYKLFTAVFQEFNILPNTVAENISQQLGTGMNTSRVNECLEIAGLTNKIAALPYGTESLMVKEVNEEAVEFSGGETQRLMLARALYKDAPILLLDEPTAALDPIAESELYERYNELSYGRTSIYISHRLASTRFCDRIIMVANKGIAEEGTHRQLMDKNGMYAELFEIQSKYYKEDISESLGETEASTLEPNRRETEAMING